MESTTTFTQHQPLLKRTLHTYRIAYEGATPKRTDIVNHLSSKEKGTVVVTHIYPLNGEPVAIVHSHVYADAAIAAGVENSKLLAKQTTKKTDAAASAEA